MLGDFFKYVFRHKSVNSGTQSIAKEHKRLEPQFKQSQKQTEETWYKKGIKPYYERPIYWAYPPMRNFYVAMSVIWKYILYGILIMGIGIVLCMIVLSFWDMGFSATINNFREMFAECQWYHLISILFFVLVIIGLFKLSPFFVKYLENTAIIFTNRCVYIKRYLLKDKIITYEELEKCIKLRKILIRNGGYVIPYKGGFAKVPVDSQNFPTELFLLLEQKCNISLPKQDIMNRAHISNLGWACGTLGGGITFAGGIITSMIGFLAEGVVTWERAVFDLYANPLIWFAAVLMALGLLLRLLLLPSTFSAYREYKAIGISILPIVVDILLLSLIIGGYMYFSTINFLEHFWG